MTTMKTLTAKELRRYLFDNNVDVVINGIAYTNKDARRFLFDMSNQNEIVKFEINDKKEINKNTIEQFERDLFVAQRAAYEAEKLNDEDGGSCNFDTVVLKTKGVPAKLLSGLDIKIDRITGERFWKGYSFVWFETHGQGNLRTRMAEAACNKLKELGYDVTMYYQLD